MPLGFLHSNSHDIRLMNGEPLEQYELVQNASRSEWDTQLTNTGDETVYIKEIVLFSGELPYAPDTPVYGEGFQMLSQYNGTLAKIRCFGGYADAVHYLIPQEKDAQTIYSLMLISPPGEDPALAAFTSCRRFSGAFRIHANGLCEVVLDTEGLALRPGETWELESLYMDRGPDREALLTNLAQRIAQHHPPLAFPEIPTGWCSWYHYYEDVTEENILDNLSAIVQRGLPLRYVQIDDGYESHMGDWLTAGERFPSGIASLLGKIRAMGLEPAIWVAPFIAEKDSVILQEHPNWFVQDAHGRPLASDTVSFGGWRNGPWYCLDGTHPEVQDHIERTFAYMRQEWGCSYFKLDANFWGAIHGGHFYDPRATRIEAYRRGMEALLRGAGDAFVLGCNAPMWGSLGLVHGMRVTNDITRAWPSFRDVAQELFSRNWQNNRLWINDPDCLVLQDINTPAHEQHANQQDYIFHASAILASGGMILSGDNLCELSPEHQEMLSKMLPPSGRAARFSTDDFAIGRTPLDGGEMIFVFNWDNRPATRTIPLPQACQLTDFWTGVDLGSHQHEITLNDVPAHSARVLRCANISQG